MSKTRLDGKVALITGAASGIGHAVAKALAYRGAELVVCDIDEERLSEAVRDFERIGSVVSSFIVDVSDSSEVERFAEEVHEQYDAVDVLVNNAGVGLYGGILDTTLEDWDWVMKTNLWGVIHGCHYFAPRMVERGNGGQILNVASIAGVIATEKLGAYSTSKFAVVGFSEALREELDRHAIGVTAVCPGLIDTAIVRGSRIHGEAEEGERREILADLLRRRGFQPDRVADAMLRAVDENPAILPVTPEAWSFYLTKRFSPGLMEKAKRWMKRLLPD